MTGTGTELSMRFAAPEGCDATEGLMWRLGRDLAYTIAGSAEDCREASLAVTKLEECLMWACRAPRKKED